MEAPKIVDVPSNPLFGDYHEERQYSYWESVYSKEKINNFDWVCTWPFARSILQEYLPDGTNKEVHALNIGCGSSKMGIELLEDGFQTVTNLDFSKTLIEKMSAIYKDEPRLKWVVGDCAQLPFNDSVFDYAFDKSALDAIFCGERSKITLISTFKEVSRVLKPGGMFIILSLGMLEHDDQYLAFGKESNLNLIFRTPVTPPEATQHYFYVYKK